MVENVYAGFWSRFGATILDTIILMIIMYPAMTFIYGNEYWMSEKMVHGILDVLIGYVLPIVATIWFWLRYKATPGKMAYSLEVVDAATGNTLTTSQAIIRYIAYIPSALALGIGFIWVAFDPKKQGWHDKIAKTVVVKNKQKAVASLS